VFHVQKMLGHSTLEKTRRYANLLTEDLQQIREKVSLLSGRWGNTKEKGTTLGGSHPFFMICSSVRMTQRKAWRRTIPSGKYCRCAERLPWSGRAAHQSDYWMIQLLDDPALIVSDHETPLVLSFLVGRSRGDDPTREPESAAMPEPCDETGPLHECVAAPSCDVRLVRSGPVTL
jgi:hypothetical protein